MVTSSVVDVKIKLDREIASELETLGLLEDSQFMAAAIAAELERRRVWQRIEATFAAFDALDDEPMSMEEIVAEVKAARREIAAERRQDANRS